MSPKLVICRGLPASGKTTWAQHEVTKSLRPEYGELTVVPSPVCRVNRDDIRQMLHNGDYIRSVTEQVVIAVRDASIRAALRSGWSVISDDTNLRSGTVRDLMKVANREGAEVEFKDFTDVDVETCITRDVARFDDSPGLVGEDVIRDQYNRFLKGKTLPLPIPELKEVKLESISHGDRLGVIVDVDGTLAHNNGHRGWYEYEKVGDDGAHENIIDLARGLYLRYGTVFILSGRSDSCREITKQWLRENVFHDTWPIEDGQVPQGLDIWDGSKKVGEPVYPQQWHASGVYLLMRQDGDHRDDAIVKYELYRDYIAPWYDIKIVLDDRDRVVRMWRQIGLTCLQVNDGDF